MQAKAKKQKKSKVVLKVKETSFAAVEEIMEKKLEDIATIVDVDSGERLV